jgi:hypothetical protein
MNEDLNHFIAQLRALVQARDRGEDVKIRTWDVMSRASLVLPPGDYVQLGEWLVEQAGDTGVELAQEAAVEAAQLAVATLERFEARTTLDLPPEARREVFARFELAESLSAPGLSVLYDDDDGEPIGIQIGSRLLR